MHLLNTYESAIRWTDLDAYGHLNNAVFFDFMTEARAELLTAILKIPNMCQFVTAQVGCDFKFPYFYPDKVILKQFCESRGNSSFLLRYEFYSARQSDRLHAQGHAKMVAYDPATKRATRLPQEVINLLEKEETHSEAIP